MRCLGNREAPEERKYRGCIVSKTKQKEKGFLSRWVVVFSVCASACAGVFACAVLARQVRVVVSFSFHAWRGH